MKPLPQFWKALDDLPGAETDRRDWAIRLGGEFPWAKPFLRPTGRRATAIDCHSPGDDDCPRGVIQSPGGGFQAVCRSTFGRCETIDLTASDIDILKLDPARLRDALTAALALQGATTPISNGRVISLGDYAVAAGVSAPVILAVPGAMGLIGEDSLRSAGLTGGHGIVLVPTAVSLPASIRERLIAQGHLLLSLIDVIAMDANATLKPVQPPELLLREIRVELLDRLAAAKPGPEVALPPGMSWAQLSLRLTSNATVICRTPGMSRQMDPGDFGMRSRKNGKPTVAWTFFTLLLAFGGRLRLSDGPSVSQRKQKEAVSHHLQATFGLAGDPISWLPTERSYVTSFVAADGRTKAEREIWNQEILGNRRR